MKPLMLPSIVRACGALVLSTALLLGSGPAFAEEEEKGEEGEVAAPMSHLWSLSVEMQFYVAIGVATFFMAAASG